MLNTPQSAITRCAESRHTPTRWTNTSQVLVRASVLPATSCQRVEVQAPIAATREYPGAPCPNACSVSRGSVGQACCGGPAISCGTQALVRPRSHTDVQQSRIVQPHHPCG